MSEPNEWTTLGNIECRCGDVFPTVESFHEHIHLSHPNADHDESAEIARLRRIEEAARALMTPHTLTTTNPPKGEPTAGWEWPEWDALRAALEENR